MFRKCFVAFLLKGRKKDLDVLDSFWAVRVATIFKKFLGCCNHCFVLLTLLFIPF